MHILGGLNRKYDPVFINLTSWNDDVSLEAQFLLQSQEMPIEQQNSVVSNAQGPSTSYVVKRGQSFGCQRYPNSNFIFFFGGKGWGNEKVVEAMLNQSASSVARLDMW